MAENNKENPKNSPKPTNNNIYWIYVVVLVFFIAGTYLVGNQPGATTINSTKLEELIRNKYIDEAVVTTNGTEVKIYLNEVGVEAEEQAGDYKIPKSGPHFTFEGSSAEIVSGILTNEKGELRINVSGEPPSPWGGFFQILIAIAILVALWFFLMRRVGAGGAGGQIFNIGKSRASLYDKENKVNVTFDDVAGLEEAKEEVQEVVEFLKNPGKYTRLGGHIPKGVLLVGPPGTGKTLLAKAVAGEAKVPFFSLSGSDFVEMFVGVGAARVRDLFKQAKEKAPCIVFIDEIDAVGRSRGRMNVTGGNDERENTLNQLLVEMDGFGSDSGVILMAATNRPDVLDPALLRAGRFDRQIGVDRPDLKSREAIFKVHLKKLTLAAEVEVKKLASQTPGFVGADIMNVCNEAALIAARKDKKAVGMDDFQDAVDRVIGGLEKKTKIISPEEKKIIAYHEAGHAITGWFLEHAHPLVKVSIVPRGMAALGYAQYLPKEQYLSTRNQILDRMCMTLGGRAAEEIIFGKENITTGAVSDLDRVTANAYGMVKRFGMNDKVGLLSFREDNEYSFAKPFSEATSQLIDEEARKIADQAYIRAKKLLIERAEELEVIAQELLEKEVLFEDDLIRLIGPRPFVNKEEEILLASDDEQEKELELVNGHSAENGLQSEEGEEESAPDLEVEDTEV